MSAPETNVVALRLRRPEWERLARALVASLVVHALLWVGYEVNRHTHFLDKIPLPVLMRQLQRGLVAPQAESSEENPAEPNVPLVFVEVNPLVAVAEPPKNAKYYSDKSSVAANPDPREDTGVPRIDGHQTQIVKTEDVLRSQAMPLQPVLPLQPAMPEAQPREAVSAAQPAGDLTLGKPATVAREEVPETRRERPRTLQEARARFSSGQLVGPKMKQEGGVKRAALESSLNVRATPFGAYDAAIIAAVQKRWYDLLDSRNFARELTGKVVLEFRLHYDGRVTDMRVVENTVDELLCLLCQKAILDPSPYERWPSDMRRMMGADFREVRFTFYYN